MNIKTTGSIKLTGKVLVTVTKEVIADNKVIKENNEYDSTKDKTISNKTNETLPEKKNEKKTETFEIVLDGIGAEMNGETTADVSGEDVIKHIWTKISETFGKILPLTR